MREYPHDHHRVFDRSEDFHLLAARSFEVRGLELQHALAPGVAAQALVGESGAGDGSAQPFQFLGLGARHAQAEAVRIDAQAAGDLLLPAGRRARAQHRLASGSDHWVIVYRHTPSQMVVNRNMGVWPVYVRS